MGENVLSQFDEEYLIGISNKGIVKRARKDIEAGNSLSLIEIKGDSQWSVAVGEEQVTVLLPLADSRCTCPSRTVCKHIIQAVLYLQQQSLPDAGENRMPEPLDEAADREPAFVDTLESTASNTALQVMEEIKTYPLSRLIRGLSARGYRSFMAGLSSGKPDISYGSVITVRLLERDITVKLLSPLAYSSCTCHKKDLCSHKAEAILWCQIEQGILTEEMLAEAGTEDVGFDTEQIAAVIKELEAFTENTFLVGLSRCARDIMEHLERLAVLCHNAGLVSFEGYCRGLKDSYERYFRHSATFDVRKLLSSQLKLMRQTKELARAKSSEELLALAGEFREEYLPVGNLELAGITMEHFVTQTGYEGDIIYFLEKNTGEWYTYSNVRPTFYENKRKGFTDKAQAPWGLSTTMEQLYKVELKLSRAKCDGSGRLSGTKETKAEIMEGRVLTRELIENWYFDDFAALYDRWFVKGPETEPNRRKLIFVDAYELGEADFSETKQRLKLPLYDKMGKEMIIQVDYSKREASTIRYLEKLKPKEHYCFLGRIYLKNGRIYMYPVAIYVGEENPYYEKKKGFFKR